MNYVSPPPIKESSVLLKKEITITYWIFTPMLSKAMASFLLLILHGTLELSQMPVQAVQEFMTLLQGSSGWPEYLEGNLFARVCWVLLDPCDPVESITAVTATSGPPCAPAASLDCGLSPGGSGEARSHGGRCSHMDPPLLRHTDRDLTYSPYRPATFSDGEASPSPLTRNSLTPRTLHILFTVDPADCCSGGMCY